MKLVDVCGHGVVGIQCDSNSDTSGQVSQLPAEPPGARHQPCRCKSVELCQFVNCVGLGTTFALRSVVEKARFVSWPRVVKGD